MSCSSRISQFFAGACTSLTLLLHYVFGMNTFKIAKFLESALPRIGVLETGPDLRGNVSVYLTDYSRITGR